MLIIYKFCLVIILTISLSDTVSIKKSFYYCSKSNLFNVIKIVRFFLKLSSFKLSDAIIDQ